MMARSTSPTCPRLFEAEAARDGRLTGAARAHFEAHAAVCASCAQEARALEQLAEALRTSGRAGETADQPPRTPGESCGSCAVSRSR